MSALQITLSCRSGDDDCTADCGWCEGTGIEKHPVNSVSVAKRVAEDFQSFERHEMPLFHYERDVEIVLWTLRCLANPLNGWSVAALAAIEEQTSREPSQLVLSDTYATETAGKGDEVTPS